METKINEYNAYQITGNYEVIETNRNGRYIPIGTILDCKSKLAFKETSNTFLVVLDVIFVNWFSVECIVRRVS